MGAGCGKSSPQPYDVDGAPPQTRGGKEVEIGKKGGDLPTQKQAPTRNPTSTEAAKRSEEKRREEEEAKMREKEKQKETAKTEPTKHSNVSAAPTPVSTTADQPSKVGGGSGEQGEKKAINEIDTEAMMSKKSRERRKSVVQAGKKIKDEYDFVRSLGSGSFATVKLVVSRVDGQQYAAKIIDKIKTLETDPEGLDDVWREIEVLQSVDHPNIVCLHQVYDEPRRLFMLMQYAAGGELFHRIVERKYFAERDAAVAMLDILKAISHLHEKGIAHRDLKPENILYESKSEDSKLMVADFGFAKLRDTGEMMKTMCGSPVYVAPEVISRVGYNTKCDMWSIGVILYILLCGYPPFLGRTIKDTMRLVKRADLQFPNEDWDRVSGEAKDLIRKLIVPDPAKRLSATEMLEHDWMSKVAMGRVKSLNITEKLRKFTAFRYGVYGVIAARRLSDNFAAALSKKVGGDVASSIGAWKNGGANANAGGENVSVSSTGGGGAVVAGRHSASDLDRVMHSEEKDKEDRETMSNVRDMIRRGRSNSVDVELRDDTQGMIKEGEMESEKKKNEEEGGKEAPSDAEAAQIAKDTVSAVVANASVAAAAVAGAGEE
mmetsp:Transcript_16104/g.40721  ORF Transcript_16104/g.40721 Transcript_16104/m.40721 type:complete len:603 (-) Transcript_16104:480-2288(-)